MVKARLEKVGKSHGPSAVVRSVFREMTEARVVGRRKRVVRSCEIILVRFCSFGFGRYEVDFRMLRFGVSLLELVPKILFEVKILAP